MFNGGFDQQVYLHNENIITGSFRVMAEYNNYPFDWYWNGGQIDEIPDYDDYFSGPNSRIMTFVNPLTPAYNGTYFCDMNGSPSRNIYISETFGPPRPGFYASVTSVFINTTLQFFNQSNGASPMTYLWDFGDGNNSTDENPWHHYEAPGVYTVSLTVSTPYGDETIVMPDYITVYDDADCPLFTDDFEDGVIDPLYEINRGTWNENNGLLSETSDYFGTGYNNGAIALIGGDHWSDYTIDCDYSSSDNDIIGFVFNYQDNDNMYMYYTYAQGEHSALVKWENGVSTTLASITETYGSGTWYHAYIFSSQGQIVIEIDGIEKYNVYDDTFTEGKVGLLSWYNDYSAWDNLVIDCVDLSYAVDVSVMLEGPFNGTGMNTDLNGLLPLEQPYNFDPYWYDGEEAVESIPNANVVDWVLLELRDAATIAEATEESSLGGQAAFILNNGSIVDLDGETPPRFDYIIENNLFVAVWHRNHLPIISKYPCTYETGTYSYDFTIAPGQAYGDNQAELNGMAAKYSGNANTDGTINYFDLEDVWGPESGNHGYLRGDMNMDAEVDNVDKNEYWHPNEGKSEILPIELPIEGMVGYYPFNGNANDESGNNNHGNVYGAVLTYDRFGNANSAYAFDGVDDYIKAAADDLPTADRTISFWFKANTVSNHPVPFAYGGGSCGHSWFQAINLGTEINTYSRESHCNQDKLNCDYTEDPVNEWFQWVMTNSVEGSKMYINGSLYCSNGVYINNTTVSDKDLALGVCISPTGYAPYADPNVGYFNGVLDDFIIYDRALTENEIEDLFDIQNPSGFTCGDLLLDERDGQSYTTVQIVTQCWMAENLNTGNMVSGVNEQTDNMMLEKYCYDDNTGNCDEYGGLYQWDEAMQYTTAEGVQGICPLGWHIPTDAEWMTLEEEVESTSGINWNAIGWRGTDVSSNIRETGTLHWLPPNTDATNSSGFTALAGGYRLADGTFDDLIVGADFYASSVSGSNAWYRDLNNNNPQVFRNNGDKARGFSVRCLKD